MSEKVLRRLWEGAVFERQALEATSPPCNHQPPHAPPPPFTPSGTKHDVSSGVVYRAVGVGVRHCGL